MPGVDGPLPRDPPLRPAGSHVMCGSGRRAANRPAGSGVRFPAPRLASSAPGLTAGRSCPILQYQLKEVPMQLKTITLLLPLLATSAHAPQAQARSGLQQPATYTYQGTVHAVRADSGSIDLITGVGFALRMVHMNIGSDTKFEAPNGKLALNDLRPGDVLTAVCHRTEKGLMADRIRKIVPESSPNDLRPGDVLTAV